MYTDIIYTPYFIEKYVRSLSWQRKMLARFFERYKVTEREYVQWAVHQLFAPQKTKEESH